MLFYQVQKGFQQLGKIGILIHQDYWQKTLLFSDASEATFPKHQLKQHTPQLLPSTRIDWVAETLTMYRSKWRLANVLLYNYDTRPSVRLAFRLQNEEQMQTHRHILLDLERNVNALEDAIKEWDTRLWILSEEKKLKKLYHIYAFKYRQLPVYDHSTRLALNL